MAKSKEIEAFHAQIAELNKKIALTDSEEEKQLYHEEILKIKEQMRAINRKAPVVVPVKDAKTVGDKIEARLKNKGRKKSAYGRSMVRL